MKPISQRVHMPAILPKLESQVVRTIRKLVSRGRPVSRNIGSRITSVFGVASASLIFAFSPSVNASIAYGTLNNFDCVNDTGVEAHGFEIELDDIHSKDITYTYDYNHYGVPKITEDNTDPLHPKVFIRYAGSVRPDGTWTAYTAIPAGPISPTDGHRFTNPSINFGGEHFGAGYYGAPTAVKYNWLIDDGTAGHNLIHGPPVMVSTPTFTYYPPAPAQIFPQVQAVIVPPPPPVPPVKQWFGEATWVKDIKTKAHKAAKVELVDLRDPDPANPGAKDWANGEVAEVETEWRILQTEFPKLGNPDPANPRGELAGQPEDLPGGDEVITRRYEFYKYIGPIDAESGEAKADAVGPDGIHGDGTEVTYNDYIDPDTGEWVTATVDTSTLAVVGEFFGAQMAAFDRAPALGLIDHIPDGDLNVAYADRTVVIGGGAAFLATTSGSLPDGTTLDGVTGIFAGTPTVAGAFTFTVSAEGLNGALVSKEYTVTITGDVVPPVTYTIGTSSSPAAGGSTSGGGIVNSGDNVTVAAVANLGYNFVNWTEGGVAVSASASYAFAASANRNLVANFTRITFTIGTSSSPAAGGSTSGGGVFNSGDNVTVVATANAGYNFVNWTEGGVEVSASASYAFAASANRNLLANFTPAVVTTYTIRDEGQGKINAIGDGYLLVGAKKLVWNSSTKIHVNDAPKGSRAVIDSFVKVGMKVQWKGLRDRATNTVMASKIEIN